MRQQITGALVAIVFFCAACGRSEKIVTRPDPPQPEAVAPSVTPPVSDFAVAGQDITFMFGRGHLRIPDGWQRLAKSEHPLEVEIESTRHRKSLDTWAICRLTKASTLNPTLSSQDTVNRYMDQLWKSIISELESDGARVAVEYPIVGNGIRAKSLSYTVNGGSIVMYALMVPNNPLMHGLMISCDGSTPLVAEDRADIAALVASFRYDRP